MKKNNNKYIINLNNVFFNKYLLCYSYLLSII